MYVRPWILRQRGARQSLTVAVLQVLPSVIARTSALRITPFSLLNRPGHTHRYRRFTCTLASARARLAVEVVANLSFLPDLHRLPQRQLARRSAIMAFGTKKQKRRCAPLVLAGDKPAICITEPGAGSAATEMTTTAVKTGDRYVVNGTKHWITGGGVSRVHLIFAQVLEDGERKGIGGFIAVRGEDAGLKTGRREPAMGLRGIPETEVTFEDLEIPDDMVLRPADGFRRGFAALMNAYNGQRLGAAMVAHGIASGAYEAALSHAKTREQFGRPIAEFQGIQWMLADMATALSASQALIYKAGWNAGSGFPKMTEAAQAKILASETAIKVTNDALQIHGAAGYSRNLPVERMVRDARMFTIGGGTAQILRNLVASSILEMKFPQTRHS